MNQIFSVEVSMLFRSRSARISVFGGWILKYHVNVIAKIRLSYVFKTLICIENTPQDMLLYGTHQCVANFEHRDTLINMCTALSRIHAWLIFATSIYSIWNKARSIYLIKAYKMLELYGKSENGRMKHVKGHIGKVRMYNRGGSYMQE